MQTAVALLCLCLWVDAHAGSKCGVPQLGGPKVPSLRVVGGTEAVPGSHPWLVSLQNRGSHFCGGAIVTERRILTAAHCFPSLSREFLGGVRVVVGEFHLGVEDESERVFGVKSVAVHEKYRHAVPMDYDVALVELDGDVETGIRVQPICLPLPLEDVPPQTSCMMGGWGRLKERGRLPARLREVRLDLLDQPRCKFVFQTVKGSALSLQAGRQRSAMTVLCAGPEGGGKDACQGDSGGPLVCPSGSGRWVAMGVSSWGKGCGRSWGNNSGRPPSRRGSPGIYTDLRLLLPWIKLHLRDAEQQQETTSSRLCSVSDGPVSDTEGIIRNPALSSDRYDNNQLCLWRLSVPPGFSVLLEFDRFHLEDDSSCQYDRLTVSVGLRRPVAILCGAVRPGPLLLNDSQNATLLFSSDISRAGSGFVMRHRAVGGLYQPGCGAVILVERQATICSPNYPGPYGEDCALRWVVYAPPGHVVKLDFSDFHLEESDGCLYDSLSVLGDVQGRDEIALLCGDGVPPPVLSYHHLMVLQFTSDGSVARRGFVATLAFVSAADLHGLDRTDVEALPDVLPAEQQDTTAGGRSSSSSSSSPASAGQSGPGPGSGPGGSRAGSDDEDLGDDEASGRRCDLLDGAWSHCEEGNS